MSTVAARVVGLFRGQGSESLRTSLVAGVMGTMVVNIGALVWSFIGIILLTSVLGTRGYGAYVYALAWATLLGVPAVLGLPQLVIRQVAGAHARGDHGLARGMIRRAYQWTFAASITVVAVGALGGVFIGREEPAVRRAYLLGLLLIPTVALYKVNESVMRGFRRVVQGRIAETTIQPVVLIGLLLGVWVLARRHLGAAVAMALTDVAATVALVISAVLVRRAIPEPVRCAVPRYDERAWLRGAAPLLVQSVAAAANMQLSLILVGALTDVSRSGVFNTALRWATFVSFVQAVVNFPLAPAIARLHVSAEHARLQRLLRRASRGAAATALPVVVGLIVFREQALGVFGPEFTSGGTALLILVVGELLSVACGSVTFAMAMTGHERALARTTIASVVLNVALGLALIPAFGIEGVAIARAVSTVGLNLVLVWQLWRREGISPAIGGSRLLQRLAPFRKVPPPP